MKCRWLIFLFLTTVGTAYAASKMAISENQEQWETPPDQAQIIFLRRPGNWADDWSSKSIFDVIDGEPKFIGILYEGNKLAYFVEPGNYTFMLIDAKWARYMRANMVGGKTYYAIYAINRFCADYCPDNLMPVHNGSEGKYQIDSDDMQNWLAKSKFVENTEASILWAEENHDMNFKKHKKFWKRWETKSDRYIAKRTLEKSDGI